MSGRAKQRRWSRAFIELAGATPDFQRGTIISPNDLQIAAHVLSLDLVLVLAPHPSVASLRS